MKNYTQTYTDQMCPKCKFPESIYVWGNGMDKKPTMLKCSSKKCDNKMIIK